MTRYNVVAVLVKPYKSTNSKYVILGDLLALEGLTMTLSYYLDKL